jgi:hypothetical protein
MNIFLKISQKWLKHFTVMKVGKTIILVCFMVLPWKHVRTQALFIKTDYSYFFHTPGVDILNFSQKKYLSIVFSYVTKNSKPNQMIEREIGFHGFP